MSINTPAWVKDAIFYQIFPDRFAASKPATPAAGWRFSGWSGACTGTGACAGLMSTARSVTANFTRITYTLTVSKNGAGAGTVVSSPSGISCGSTCSRAFNAGTTVTLSATPAAGSAFYGWSGACTGLGSWTVPMDMAKTPSAAFGPP